jgi:tetratricopeptide (TPR) repeat protein
MLMQTQCGDFLDIVNHPRNGERPNRPNQRMPVVRHQYVSAECEAQPLPRGFQDIDQESVFRVREWREVAAEVYGDKENAVGGLKATDSGHGVRTTITGATEKTTVRNPLTVATIHLEGPPGGTGVHGVLWYSRFVTDAPNPRRAMLEGFLAANPDDAFARYGLALECVSAGDNVAAEQHFRRLLTVHPEYVPGYFHYGQLLMRLSRAAEAQGAYRTGIDAARKAGDSHALSELEAALEESRGA